MARRILLIDDDRMQRLRIEAAHQVKRRPDGNRRGHLGIDLGRMEHRHQRHHPVARRQLHIHSDTQRFQIDTQMIADHALGRGGGAAGIQIG